MRKVFVTGGAGFIGSAFVKLVLDETEDCVVTNFDALTYAGNLDNLQGLDENRHRFVRGDIADRDAVIQMRPARHSRSSFTENEYDQKLFR